jgi:serine/threonine protein kinase
MLGEEIGNFRVVSRLGRGGMGEVYLGEQLNIKTKVAIKVLLPEISSDMQQVQRFFNEAVAVGRINHAGITKIFDVGFHLGRAYLIMELLEGESLAARIQRSGRLSIWQAADFGKQIASVLEATHAAGITHRDLKPDNVFLVLDGELAGGERVKILDFGIAKLGATNLTATSAKSMGTPTYMAPEQWKNAAKVDWRADAYALGCVAFEMTCGRPPFIAETVGEACTMHLTEPPPSARSFVPAVPAVLEELLANLLEKDRERRPASMREIGRAFEAAGSGQPRLGDVTMRDLTSQSRLEPTIAPANATAARDRPRSRRWLGLALAGTLAIGAAGVVVWTRGPSQPVKRIEPPVVVDAVKPAPRVPVPVPVSSPAMPNAWIRIDPPARPFALGIDLENAPDARRGFRPSRKIMSPSKPYEIQEHEVTWSELEPWLATSSEVPVYPVWARDPASRAQLPASNVTWTTAYNYCKSLGGRLPTDEQWEYAARGHDRRPNPWGTARIDLVLTHALAGAEGRPVRVKTSDQDRTAKPAIFDLIGNVQEWTRDLWREDTSERDESWVQAGGATFRAIRGLPLMAEPGTFEGDGAAYREPLCATGPCVEKTRDKLLYVGFRCVHGAEVGHDEPQVAVAKPHGAVRESPVAVVPPPPAAAACDEASCAASNNDAECCDKFRSVEPPVDAAVPPQSEPPVAPEVIDRDMIARGIRSVRARIDACGAAFSGAGLVKVSVSVAADGKVASITIKSSPDDWLGACVKQRLQLAEFAQTQHGFAFSYGFTF